VSTFLEAYQAGAFAVLPFVLLFVGQMAGVLYFDVIVTVILGAIIWLIDGFLFWIGGKGFSRGAILSRLS
jgi:fatty-acid desaturase